MRKFLVSALTSLALMCGPVSAQVGSWGHYLILDSATDAKIAGLTTWLNNCKPNSIADVSGFLTQGGGAGSDYNIYVFCKQGSGNNTYSVVKQNWGNDVNYFINNGLKGRVSDVIGFYDGWETDVVFLIVQN